MRDLALIARAADHGTGTAVISRGAAYSYADLLRASHAVASRLLDGRADLRESRIAFLVTPGFDYVAVQWGIWRAGGIAVPLATSHPPPELAYVLADTGATALIADAAFHDVAHQATSNGPCRLLSVGDAVDATQTAAALPALGASRRAMILYTSGTTSRPKGVVITHGALVAQIRTLVDAWEWRRDDHILCVLPLHHVHGIVNILACALWSGARCTVQPSFDAAAVWDEIGRGELTLFMAVPTIYSRLIAAWRAAPSARRAACSAACARMRLMVSGSAALPVSVLDEWRALSGHTLLERYGMTEIGMALSNPLHGERRPGHVGVPLPGVDVRLVDDAGDAVPAGSPGEIEVRGPGVFREYWQRPDATRDAFREGGWFRTGDVAVIEAGYYRILGRSSIDIIKTGGYKVSALEIEEVLRTHPDVRECAVVGIADEEWGERVAAAIIMEDAGSRRPPLGRDLMIEALREWLRARLAPYKVPSRIAFVDELPRNAMGKVTKTEVRTLFD